LANLDKKNVRYNIIIIISYIIGIILILQLFNLQIVHGEEYLEQSNSRLTRETTIKAARGNILDCNGNLLAGTTTKYALEIYKSKIEENELNDTIIKVINILEKNGDSYIDNFWVEIDPIKFKYEDNEKITKLLKENELDESLNAENVLNKYIEKYQLQEYSLQDARKIISVRYGIEKNGYSSMKAYVISNNISKLSVLEFEEQKHNFPGVATKDMPIRSYTYGSLASHVIGYVGKINAEEYKNNQGYDIDDYIGKTGTEYVLEKYLKGEDGTRQVDMSIDGTKTAEYTTKEAIGGNDVVLTIDSRVQQKAEESLKDNIAKIKAGEYGTVYNVETASAFAINVNTGEIIAMCSYPDFEPELFVNGISQEKWDEYTKEGKSALINRTLQSAYAPGSIFKMIPAIAGLETEAISIDEIMNCTGIYPKGYKPKCWYYSTYGRGHGNINVTGAIKGSCNCFFYEVGTRIGIEKIEQYAEYFGLGQKTNVELPGEVSGTLAGLKLYDKLGETWYYGNTLSAVIGQAENNFTPIQMAKYIAMLTNGGHNIDVTLIKKVINAEKLELDKDEISNYINKKLGIRNTEKQDLNIKQENLNAILEGMKAVTSELGGTAYSVFKDFPVTTGGKTGSAENGTGTNAWFVGFAPYEKPEIAVVVFLENGNHGYHAARVAKDIMEKYFGINEVISEDRTAKPYVD